MKFDLSSPVVVQPVPKSVLSVQISQMHVDLSAGLVTWIADDGSGPASQARFSAPLPAAPYDLQALAISTMGASLGVTVTKSAIQPSP